MRKRKTIQPVQFPDPANVRQIVANHTANVSEHKLARDATARARCMYAFETSWKNATTNEHPYITAARNAGQL